MNFNEAYNYLLSLQNLPRQEYMSSPRDCEIYLKRLRFFLAMLDHPEKSIPHYIHVAGTSGKGSVVTFLHSILSSAKIKVGSTESPHPTIITERWKINDKQMSQKEFIELVEFIKPKLDEYIKKTPYDMLSFFEVLETIGFLYFKKHRVEWVVVETGCGGRYDSSNIIPHKEVAVITNIGLDHLGIIGNNKSEIAFEKAGIIKPGSAVFSLETDKKIKQLIIAETEKNAGVFYPIQAKPEKIIQTTLAGSTFVYDGQTYTLNTPGAHQIKNAILCIKVAEKIGIKKTAIVMGLKQAVQPLRFEVWQKNPLTILDGAHNIDKIKTTVATVLSAQTTADKKSDIHLVVGFSADKNIAGMIKELSKLRPISVACTRNTTNHFRAVADPKHLSELFHKYLPQAKVEIFLDPETALSWSKKQAKKSAIVLVTGSIFVSGQLRHI